MTNRIQEIDAEYAKLKLARREKPYKGDFGMARSALSIALQDEARERGIPFPSSDELHKHLDRYAEAVQYIANKPTTNAHPKVQGVIQTAQRLVAPDEVGKDETGRHELTNTVTQPGLRELAGLMRKNGLLHAADLYLSKKYKDHVPFTNYNPKVIKRPAGFVELPKVAQTHEPTPGEVKHAIDAALPGAIKPATDEVVKPADLRTVRRTIREDSAQQAVENPVLSIDDDGAPLPLAETPLDDPKLRHKERHALIGELVLAQKSAGEITAALSHRFGISNRAAKQTLVRWLDLSRKGMRPADEPHKLARKGELRMGQTEPGRKEQVADLYNGVDPHIAGTRLAMHLIQIIKDSAPPIAPTVRDKVGPNDSPYSKEGKPGGLFYQTGGPYGEESGRATLHQLAKAALAGKSVRGVNGNVYEALGKRLHNAGHPLAKSYNWHTMDRSMTEDSFIKEFIRKHVARPEGISDREFYSRVVRTYDAMDAKDKGEHHAKFWKRLEDAYRRHPLGLTEAGGVGPKMSDALKRRLTDSMYRLHTLADDREASGEIDAKKDRDWRREFGLQWANKHMKFDRDALAGLFVLAKTNDRVRLALARAGVKVNLARRVSESNSRIVSDAKDYHEKHGHELGLKPFDPTPSNLVLDPERSKAIAKVYEARKHAPNDPEVKAAYEAFKKETLQQFQHATSRGVKFLPWKREGQPYRDSQEMRDHLDATHSLHYFPTLSGYDAAGGDHPMLEQVPGMEKGVVYNDLFRAVHEYYAHGMHGHEFGPKGELRAWHEHAKMYSPLARKALTPETYGQTSWFFFGPHTDKPRSQRPFPEQRAATFDEEHYPTKL